MDDFGFFAADDVFAGDGVIDADVVFVGIVDGFAVVFFLFFGIFFFCLGLFGCAVGVVKMLEDAVFALERAFGGDFVAVFEIVHFAHVGIEAVEGEDVVRAVHGVEGVGDADAVPVGLGGFEDETWRKRRSEG